MKKNQFSEIKNKPDMEIERELLKAQVRARSLRTAIATGKVKSLKEMKGVKKTVAQLKTLLCQKRVEVNNKKSL